MESSFRENGKYEFYFRALIVECVLRIRTAETKLKGAFTRQSKNGTDPTKTGTVPRVFAKKQ